VNRKKKRPTTKERTSRKGGQPFLPMQPTGNGIVRTRGGKSLIRGTGKRLIKSILPKTKQVIEPPAEMQLLKTLGENGKTNPLL